MLCAAWFSGTEPWHFYFVNGILNFNLVFALALFSLPLTALMETLLHRFNGEDCVCVCVSYTSTKKMLSLFALFGGWKRCCRLSQQNNTGMCNNKKCCGDDALRFFHLIVLVLSCWHSSAQLQQVILGNRLNADMMLSCTKFSYMWRQKVVAKKKKEKKKSLKSSFLLWC